MKIIQKCILTDEEKSTLEAALKIIDNLAAATETDMTTVFCKINDSAKIVGDYEYFVPKELDLGKFKK